MAIHEFVGVQFDVELDSVTMERLVGPCFPKLDESIRFFQAA